MSQCDKLHNARSIVAELRQEGDAVWAKFKGGRDETLWYYRSLLEAYASPETTAPGTGVEDTELLAELRRVVRQMHELV